MTGWLDDLTDWFREQFEKLFGWLVQLVKDAILWFFEAMFKLAEKIINAIPVPEWLTQTSIAQLLGEAGPTVAWAVSTLKIGEAVTVIGAAYSFRMIRKIITLGRW